MPKIKNQNIQFLRGFAVIIVFFFHYNSQLFNSFYVGVDIFFLISGYVITTSIFEKKSFNLFNYYLKRIKRIYPNLIFILLIFSIFYFLLYDNFTDDYTNNFFSIIFSFFGISNLYYSTNATLFYFNEEIRWLIHTWSLSIEIQFYFIFGLISFFFYRCFKNDFDKINYLKISIIIFFFLSFLLFLFTEIKYLSDYYSLPGRLWEFMLGSIIYFFPQKKKFNFNILILLFIFFISFSNFFFLNYKFIIILSLIFFFIVLLYSKNHSSNLITKLFTYFGKISYSFYLWHLILISFLKNYFQFPVLDFLIIFLITTIFSVLTYHFIELKFNKRFLIDVYFEKIIKISFLASTIFLIYLSLTNFNLSHSIFNKLNKYSINFFHYVDKINIREKDLNKIVLEQYDSCENNYENFSWFVKVNCIKKDSAINLLYVFGNSYGNHLIPALSNIPNVTLYNANFENQYLSKDYQYNETRFNKVFNQYLEISNRFSNKIIIISLNSVHYSKKKLAKMLDKIDDNNTKIIIMYPHPDLRVFKDKKKLNEYNFIKDNDFELLKSYPNIVVFESFKFLCMKCSVYDYSKLLNDDGNHFNLHGSLLLIDSLKKIISYN